MPLNNHDFHEMVNNAKRVHDEYSPEAEESIQQESPSFRDRTRGRSKYMRKALGRILSMNKKAREAYTPRNGFEEMAFAIFDAAMNKNKGKSNTSVAAWKEIKETLGERIGSSWKDTIEQKSGAAVIVNDMPTAERKPQ